MRLHRESLTWSEFRDFIQGLLQSESRLWRALAPKEDEPPGVQP